MLAALVGMVAAGCGGSGDEASGATAAGSVVDDPAADDTGPDDAGADDTGGAGASTTEAELGTDTSSGDEVVDTADPEAAGPAVFPQGFSTVTVEITDVDGEVCEVCVWLADTADERGRGLMGVTDLGDAAGMLFAFQSVGEHRFYMLNTVTPLSIAWYGDDGSFVSSTDMEPCLDPPAGGCPLYPPGGPAQYALEVFQGGLADVGATEGSTLEVRWDTEASSCPELAG